MHSNRNGDTPPPPGQTPPDTPPSGQTPPSPVDRQTPVKHYLLPYFVCGR